MNRFSVAILSALVLTPAFAMAQPKPATAAAPAAQPTIEQLDILGVRTMNEGDKAVACVATLRIIAGATDDKPLADELNSTAMKFREHAVKNGITEQKGSQLMQTFAQKFQTIPSEAQATQTLDFYAVNCMRAGYGMGFTTIDIMKPRPATAPAPAKAPTKAPAPKK